jgi:hypothetical protein
VIRAVFAALLVAPVAAAPIPKEDDAARLRRLYGVPVDPDKDCTFEMVGEKLRIKVPGKHHSLHPNPGLFNAPRVAKEVEGDFSATVRVAFPIRPSPGPEADQHAQAFATAGLVAWAEDGETVRLVRKEYRLRVRQGECFDRTWSWVGPKKGKGYNGFSSAFDVKGSESGWVRLGRSGQKLTAAYSRDGKEWTADSSADGVELGWGGKVKVGLIAENGYSAAFEAVFDEYTLTVPKK